jgi:hypothetical protein
MNAMHPGGACPSSPYSRPFAARISSWVSGWLHLGFDFSREGAKEKTIIAYLILPLLSRLRAFA